MVVAAEIPFSQPPDFGWTTQGECPMRHVSKTAILAVVLMSVAAPGYAQSLGDVAREQRQKQQSKAAPAKVLTNEDIPEQPGSADNSGTGQHPGALPASSYNAKKTADQWKAEISRQKSSVASLQNQIEHLNSSIHFTGPNCVRNCVQHNQQQLDKEDQVKHLQGQLDEQKKRLEDLQEGARQDGYGGSVSDP
jgi:predicted RNase H-like nuclease (RuvC/YqgF family)